MLINQAKSDINLIEFRFGSVGFSLVSLKPHTSCSFDLHDLIIISIFTNTFPL